MLKLEHYEKQCLFLGKKISLTYCAAKCIKPNSQKRLFMTDPHLAELSSKCGFFLLYFKKEKR